ncbi:MAG: hypothetical protein ABSB33_01340 [Tepidisphaeraceae bacterium]|jgi:hypothetical protein
MSSWVAPAIAAEIWGVSVEHVLAGIADGSIPSHVDGQFLFVDMAGIGYARSTPRPQIVEPVVTSEELRALTFEPAELASDSFAQGEDMMSEEEDGMSPDVGVWRMARQQASRTRQPPRAEAA